MHKDTVSTMEATIKARNDGVSKGEHPLKLQAKSNVYQAGTVAKAMPCQKIEHRSEAPLGAEGALVSDAKAVEDTSSTGKNMDDQAKGVESSTKSDITSMEERRKNLQIDLDSISTSDLQSPPAVSNQLSPTTAGVESQASPRQRRNSSPSKKASRESGRKPRGAKSPRKPRERRLSSPTRAIAEMDGPSPSPGSAAETYLQEAASNKVDAELREKRLKVGKAKFGRKKFRKHRRKIRKPKGKIITDTHEQYALTYGMMMGIRVSVGHHTPFSRSLTMDDFMKVNKMDFPPGGSSSRAYVTPPHKLKNTFKFKDYAPDIFRQIRKRFRIDSADYMLSLCGDFNYIEFISNSKSGQFFFYSHDGRHMIKTQTKAESKFLRRILPHYYKYVMDNPNTMITRFYGMHRVKMHHLRSKMRFVIMGSVFYSPHKIHQRFDLKGSTIGRAASEKDRREGGVLKDNDLEQDGVRIELGKEMKDTFLGQIRKDVQFLQTMKIMDYSLLIGIHDSSKENERRTRQRRSLTATDAESAGISEPLETRPRSNSASQVPAVDSRESRRNWEKLDQSAFPSPTVSTDGKTSDTEQAMLSDLTIAEEDMEGLKDEDVETEVEEAETAEKTNFSDDSEYDDDSWDEEDEDCYEEGEDLPPNIHPLSPRLLQETHQGVDSIFQRNDGGIAGRIGAGEANGKLYLMGIIDILQQYNSRKRAETWFKGFKHDRKQISAVDPQWYAERFVKFLDRNID